MPFYLQTIIIPNALSSCDLTISPCLGFVLQKLLWLVNGRKEVVKKRLYCAMSYCSIIRICAIGKGVRGILQIILHLLLSSPITR